MIVDAPDFKAFARSWVQNDPRLGEISSDQADTLVARLAQALDRRRQLEAPKVPSEQGRLTLSLESDCLQSPQAISGAIESMAQVMEQQATKFTEQ